MKSHAPEGLPCHVPLTPHTVLVTTASLRDMVCLGFFCFFFAFILLLVLLILYFFVGEGCPDLLQLKKRKVPQSEQVQK